MNMKRCLLPVILCLLSLCASAQRPKWITTPPRADNDTYIYKVVSGTGFTIGEAKTKAFKEAIREAGASVTLPAISDNTDIQLLPQTYNIPIRIECHPYTTIVKRGPEKDKYIVYLLCKVAQKGNIQVDWGRNFNKCNEEYSDGNALLFSAFIPGLGQIQKRRYGIGFITLLGEGGLVGAGTYCYLSAQNKLDVMHSENVSYTDFTKARDDYNKLKDASYVIWGVAAGLYVFNLITAYKITPHSKDGITFAPTVLPTETTAPAPGVAMRIKF